MLFPGTSPNSATVNALVNARSDAAALNSRMTCGWDWERPLDTDMATNRRPMSVAAEVAMTTKKSL